MRTLGTSWSLKGKEVFQKIHPVLSGDGFWMKLEPPDWKFFVVAGHDFTCFGFGGDFQAVGECFAFEKQGVVASDFDVLRNTFEKSLGVVL